MLQENYCPAPFSILHLPLPSTATFISIVRKYSVDTDEFYTSKHGQNISFLKHNIPALKRTIHDYRHSLNYGVCGLKLAEMTGSHNTASFQPSPIKAASSLQWICLWILRQLKKPRALQQYTSCQIGVYQKHKLDQLEFKLKAHTLIPHTVHLGETNSLMASSTKLELYINCFAGCTANLTKSLDYFNPCCKTV